MPGAAPPNRPSLVERAFAAVYGPPAARHRPSPDATTTASAGGRPARSGAPAPPDPASLIGVDGYRSEDRWHLVTVGLAAVRSEESATPFGHELTLLTPAGERAPGWAFALLLGTARTSIAVGRPYHAGARLAPGGALDGGDSGLVALGLRDDPHVTPPAGLQLLQAVGITTGEYLLMQRVGTLTVLERLAQRDPLLRTDPTRA